MYDELVKALRFIAKQQCRVEGEQTKICAQAADAIEELSRDLDSMNEANIALYGTLPKWIPVTERLPGTGEIVLVYGRRGGIYTAEHNRNARWPGSFWKLNSKSHHCEPTHWMPLPEPPKEV